MTGQGICKEVVVKFTLHHYGIAVHEFLASKSQAPKVFHYKSLPGNWHVVVMEKVKGVSLEHLDESTKSQLKAVLDNLNSERLCMETYAHRIFCNWLIRSRYVFAHLQ